MKYLIFALLLVMVTAVGVFFIYGEQWAHNKLEKQLNSIENLSYDTLHIDLAQKRIVFKQLKYNRDNIEIEVPSTIVQNINILKILIQDVLHIELLQLDSASFIYRVPEQVPEKPKTEKQFVVRVDKIDLVQAHFKAYRDTIAEPFVSAYVDMKLEDVVSDELKEIQDIISQISDLKINNITYITASGRYHLLANSIFYNKEERSLLGKEVKLIPQYDKYQFAKVVGHEVDWMHLSVDSILLRTNSINEFITDKHISQLFIFRPEFEVFRDRRLPFPENHRPQILKEVLAEKGNSFGIDSISIVHGNISYQEHISGAEQPGEITFSALEGQIVNLFTYDHMKKEKPRLQINCRLYDATMLYADVSFPNTVHGPTLVKGKVDPMQLQVFNQMLDHVASTRISSGQLNSLDFEFSYDSIHSKGQMELNYSDLEVAFLQRDTNKIGEIINDAKSFIANTFVVEKNNNENSNGEIRIGDIDYERNREKSMFNFWWKSILTGFQSSTGVKPPAEKAER